MTAVSPSYVHVGADDIVNRTMRTLSLALAATTAGSEAYSTALDGIVDWPAVLDLAARHGVDGVLHHYATVCRYALPREVETTLVRRAFVRGVTSRRMHDITTRLLGALEKSGVRAVPLKGTVLAWRVYADPWLRPSTDIDVLVGEADLDQARGVFAELGFECTDSAERIHMHRLRDYHITFASRELEVVVELHFCAYRASGGQLGADDLLERAQICDLDDKVAIRVLAAEDEFLYLAAHAAKHFEVSLRLLYDLKLFAERHPDLDVPTVLARSHATGTNRALALATTDLEQFLDLRIPGLETGARLGRRAPIVSYVRRIHARPQTPRQLHAIAGLAAGAALADSYPSAIGTIRRGLGRLFRRTVRSRFPRVAPRDWDI